MNNLKKLCVQISIYDRILKNYWNLKENTNKFKGACLWVWNMLKKMVEPAALNCTLGEHSYKNDNPNDIKLSILIQLGFKDYRGQ